MKKLYKIIRFYADDRHSELIAENKTLKEAQKHCKREDTHSKDKNGNLEWFEGYEEM